MAKTIKMPKGWVEASGCGNYTRQCGPLTLYVGPRQYAYNVDEHGWAWEVWGVAVPVSGVLTPDAVRAELEAADLFDDAVDAVVCRMAEKAFKATVTKWLK